MTKDLIAKWNETVKPEDTVYHLGDFGLYKYRKFLNGKIMDSDYTLEEILSNKTIQREQGILGSFLLKPKKTSDNHYLWCIKTAIEFSAYLYEFKAQLEGSTSFAQADQMDNKYHTSFFLAPCFSCQVALVFLFVTLH